MRGRSALVGRPSPRDLLTRLYEARVPVGAGAVALLLVVGGWWGYQSWRAGEERLAQALLARAFQDLDPLIANPATAPAPEAATHMESAVQLLSQVRTQYPSSHAAGEALLQTGNIFYQQGKYPEAYGAYQGYLERYPNGRWVLLAGLGKGYALEAQGRLDQAADTYRTLADRYQNSTIRVEALIALARCLKELGRPAEADAAYHRVIEDYPGSSWARRAEEWSASLER